MIFILLRLLPPFCSCSLPPPPPLLPSLAVPFCFSIKFHSKTWSSTLPFKESHNLLKNEGRGALLVPSENVLGSFNLSSQQIPQVYILQCGEEYPKIMTLCLWKKTLFLEKTNKQQQHPKPQTTTTTKSHPLLFHSFCSSKLSLTRLSAEGFTRPRWCWPALLSHWGSLPSWALQLWHCGPCVLARDCSC